MVVNGLGMAVAAIAVGAVISSATPVVASGFGLDQRFAGADLNADGFVDEAEMALDSVTAFTRLDANGDQKLSFDELVDANRAAFTKMDRNGDGFISPDELLMAKLITFSSLDANQDGGVTMAEIRAGSRLDR